MTAGPVRLRPILMTAVSTVAGMLPVAIGWDPVPNRALRWGQPSSAA